MSMPVDGPDTRHGGASTIVETSLASDDGEMLLRGATDCVHRDGAIEGHEPSVSMDRQCEEVHVSELAWPVDSIGVNDGVIKNADGVGPELMLRCGARVGKLGHRDGRRYGVGICGLRQNSDAAVLGDGARRPACFRIVHQPGPGAVVILVTTVEKGDQHIDVE